MIARPVDDRGAQVAVGIKEVTASETASASAETWPGPGVSLAWLSTLAMVGMLIGGVVGFLVSSATEEQVTVSSMVRVLPDAEGLRGPLALPPTVTDHEAFLAAEMAWIDAEGADQEAAAESMGTLSISQVGTSDVFRLSATSATAAEAKAAVAQLLDSYVQRRQEAATVALQAGASAVQERLASLGVQEVQDGPQAQEVQRLLEQQSEFQAAAARLPGLVPVLRPPTVEKPTGAPAAVLYGLLGAALGAVLLLGAGAIWRATSPRLFDARFLVAAGIPVLLPRLPAGSVRARTDQLPSRQPAAGALSAARLLLPQVLNVSAEPRCFLVLGAGERSGSAEVTWQLAWALSTRGTSVAVVTTTQSGEFGGEREPAHSLFVVEVPAGDGSSMGAAVRRHLAAGRHVLVHAGSLSEGVHWRHERRHTPETIVVVGEGISSLEGSLAAYRDASSSTDIAFLGVAVTTTRRWTAGRRASTIPPRHAQHGTSRQQEPPDGAHETGGGGG